MKWYEDFLPSARELCPKTVTLLNSIPSVHGAMFTMLPAHARLGPHRDPFAGSLRYHLGLVTPNSDQCCIYVDGQFCTWRDGEDFVFDETFEHALQAHRFVVVGFEAVEMHGEEQIRRRLEQIQLLFEQQRIRAQRHELLESELEAEGGELMNTDAEFPDTLVVSRKDEDANDNA